jgi:hypothetical protein
MFGVISTNLRRIFSVLRFGVLTLRYAGPKVTLQKLGHQLYGRTVFLYTIGEMGSTVRPPRFPSYTILATEDDMRRVFGQIQGESDEGKYQLLVRKWYHERGIGTPYVQKTLDTDEICCIRWMVTAEDMRRTGLSNRFPELEDDEFMLENVYTFERFRNKGVQTSSKMSEITKSIGLVRIKGHVTEDNVIELRALRGWDSKVYARVLERHFLFRVSRKTLKQYDPPIALEITDFTSPPSTK